MKESTPAAWMGLARRSLRSFLIAICVAVGGSFLGATPTSAIIGGDPAEGDGAVVLVGPPNRECSGFLYKPRIVVTAAHCIQEGKGIVSPVNQLRVYPVGALKGSAPGITPVAVFMENMFFIDGGEEVSDMKKDIAYLVLDRDLGTSNITGAITSQQYLDLRRSDIQFTFEVVGYGDTPRTDPTSAQTSAEPRRIEFPNTPWKREYVTADEYRIDPALGMGTCAGDSGGLVAIKGNRGERLAVGVVAGNYADSCEVRLSKVESFVFTPMNFSLLWQAEQLAGYQKTVPYRFDLPTKAKEIILQVPATYGSADRKLSLDTNYVIQSWFRNKDLPNGFKSGKVEYAVKIGNSWRKLGLSPLKADGCKAKLAPCFTSLTSIRLDRDATLFPLSKSRRLIEDFAEKSGWKRTLLKTFGSGETSEIFDWHVQKCPCVVIGYRFSGEKDFVGEVLIPAKR